MFNKIKFLLIDDGSTDGSGEIAQSYLFGHRFRYYEKKNGGASSARNAGIKLSKGNCISFVDSDGVVHDNMAKYLYSVTVETGADIISGTNKMFDENIEFGELGMPYCEIDSLSFIKVAYSCCARLFERFFSAL